MVTTKSVLESLEVAQGIVQDVPEVDLYSIREQLNRVERAVSEKKMEQAIAFAFSVQEEARILIEELKRR